MDSFERQEYHVTSVASNNMPTNSQYGVQLPYTYHRQASRNDSEIMSLETRSDYCLPVTDCNYNPHPRGWRRQTWKLELIAWQLWFFKKSCCVDISSFLIDLDSLLVLAGSHGHLSGPVCVFMYMHTQVWTSSLSADEQSISWKKKFIFCIDNVKNAIQNFTSIYKGKLMQPVSAQLKWNSALSQE